MLLIAATAMVVGLGLSAPAHAAKDDLVFVSRADGPSGVGADGFSSGPAVSADGRYVAFQSGANNLSLEDNNAFNNIFVRDVQTGRTIFVSRATGPSGAPADGASNEPVISADGRYVAFQSDANNLSDEDNNAVTNIFVRDLQAGTTTYVSRATGVAGAAADAGSFAAAISADGRHVAFQSDADNLSAEDNNAVVNIFVRDLQTGTTTLVTRANGAAGAGASDHSFWASISGDGRHVAFQSDADNLSTEDNDAVTNIFVRDVQTGTTTLVSRAGGATGASGDGSSFNASISSDGRRVAFESDAANLSGEDNDAVRDIFVRDLQSATTTLVSRASGPAGAPGDDGSFEPSISFDGRYVAFISDANNLSTEDNDAVGNIFLRDLQTGATILASRASGPAGAPADSGSGGPDISGNGRFVAFSSAANNLSTEDNDSFSNIYLRDVLGGFALTLARAGSGQGAVTSSPAGINCGTDCTEEFTTGTAVTLTATAAPGSSFAGFSGGGCSGSGPCTVTADQARNITATFNVATTARPPVGTPSYPRPPFGAVPAAPFADCPTATANIIRGTIASERINGTPRADRIFAGTGDDVVDGLAANDCIDLGPGTDRGQGGSGSDLIVGGLGRDRISGSSGNDRLRGGSSGDRLIGGFGGDRLHGQSGADRVNGERGRDRINGGSSRDVISGGSSGDRIAGDQGNDRINGNSGNDRIRGNSGADRIKGSTGADRIAGDSGNDRINARDGRRDRVSCGRGRDRVIADRRDRVARSCERVVRRG